MLILASGSLSRRRLLDFAGISYNFFISGVDENSFRNVDPHILVQDLAIAKAKAVQSQLFSRYKNNLNHIEKYIVLGCDSAFEFEGKIFGKPANQSDAIDRLKTMSGKFGYLHTGHAFISSQIPTNIKSEVDHIISRNCIFGTVSTRVQFVEMNNHEIINYVSTGEPMQCAGGFDLDPQRSKFIKSINGCYSNVIGLSLPWLRKSFLLAGLNLFDK